MLLDRELHVDPASVHLGHAITANAAQGCEYQTVIGKSFFEDLCEDQRTVFFVFCVLASERERLKKRDTR